MILAEAAAASVRAGVTLVATAMWNRSASMRTDCSDAASCRLSTPSSTRIHNLDSEVDHRLRLLERADGSNGPKSTNCSPR